MKRLVRRKETRREIPDHGGQVLIVQGHATRWRRNERAARWRRDVAQLIPAGKLSRCYLAKAAPQRQADAASQLDFVDAFPHHISSFNAGRLSGACACRLGVRRKYAAPVAPQSGISELPAD